MTETTTRDEIIIRAKAFSCEGVRSHRALIDGDTLRVWDSVAGHYTTCHSISPRRVHEIIRKHQHG